MNRQFSYNLLNIASRFVNFILFLVVVDKYGATLETDWFFFLYGFVYFIISVLFYSVECALVPLWPKMDEQERSGFLFTCIRLGRIGGVVLLAVGLIFSTWVPQKLGFLNPFSCSETILLSVLLFIQPFFAFNAALYSSHLQASGRYFWPITHLSFRAVGVLAVLALPTCNSIMCLTIAYTCGEFIRLLALFVASRGEIGGGLQLVRFEFRKFKNQFTAIGWMIFMVLAASTNVYLDFIMVGRLNDGSASLVEYAGRLRGLPLLVLNGFLVVTLGDWSRLNKSTQLTWSKVCRGTCQVGLWGLSMCVVLIITRQVWLPLIFKDAVFGPTQQFTLNSLMGWYLVGAIFVIVGSVISRAFLVWQRFKLMAIFSFLSVLVNAGLNVFFINLFGVVGVAMSTAILDFVMMLIFIYWGVKVGNEVAFSLDDLEK